MRVRTVAVINYTSANRAEGMSKDTERVTASDMLDTHISFCVLDEKGDSPILLLHGWVAYPT